MNGTAWQKSRASSCAKPIAGNTAASDGGGIAVSVPSCAAPILIHWTELGRAMPEPDALQIMDPTAFRYRWIIYYTNALYRVGSVDDARAWTARALQQDPDDAQHLANLRFFDQAGRALAGVAR